jgi:uncharacterized SAM-binding protein YcdF (DUF218 family)/glycosyltransferase involved in cell wall biosynthesis
MSTDYIIISSIDWTTHWQMHQQLAKALVSNGERVLFIENTGARGPKIGDVSRIRERICNWFKSTHGFTEIEKNLTIYSCLFIPLPYFKFAVFINNILISNAIKKWMRIVNFNSPVVITFLPTPLAHALIEEFDPVLLIYYCANNMSEALPDMKKLGPWEEELFKKSDLVFSISEEIRERALVSAKYVYSYPAGVDFSLFENAKVDTIIPEDLDTFPRPIVGYVGALSGVLDQKLIIEMAKQMPSVTFALIGPTYTNISDLLQYSNIKILGIKQHNLIPAYIKGFDVGIIPYVVNKFTDSVYSCKLNEYLAMGLPVVSSDMREIRSFIKRHGSVLMVGKDTSDFIGKVKLSIEESNQAKRDERIAIAKSNSWLERFVDISKTINYHLEIKRKNIKDNWQEKIIKKYKQKRFILIKKISLILACYILLFHSPIVWIAGDQLAVSHEPQKVDAIVVLSGDGEINYINQSYQRRTLDAIKYFKNGYASQIIISSGRDQTFSEVEIIKSLLVKRGVPEDVIFLINEYPKSTFENISLINDKLNKNNIKSIILITSPYHSRRALWIFRKTFPELIVLAPKVIDTPSKEIEWSTSVDQLRVIVYEYVSIIYNYSKNQI